MPKRTSSDPTIFAKKVFDHIVNKYDPEAAESVMVADSISDDKPGKNPHAQALGKLGGSKGGHARAANLSPAKRKQIAKKAAKARWTKKD
jgi:FMN phosphatase YigB (HAD superfamily)